MDVPTVSLGETANNSF